MGLLLTKSKEKFSFAGSNLFYLPGTKKTIPVLLSTRMFYKINQKITQQKNSGGKYYTENKRHCVCVSFLKRKAGRFIFIIKYFYTLHTGV